VSTQSNRYTVQRFRSTASTTTSSALAKRHRNRHLPYVHERTINIMYCDTDPIFENSPSSPALSVTDASTNDELSASDGSTGGSPWLSFSSLAKSIKKTIPAAVDGFASTVHRSAVNLMQELSELENEARRERGCADYVVLPLPWEILFKKLDEDEKDVREDYEEDEVLKKRILDLSQDETIFTHPFLDIDTDDDSFVLDDSRVLLIRRILEIDGTLGNIHARLSGRSELKETVFWKNYFFHCSTLRTEREKELNEEILRKCSHDDELDAELVLRPPASCTGFYPKTGELQSMEDISSRPSYDSQGHEVKSKESDAISASGSFVMVDSDDED